MNILMISLDEGLLGGAQLGDVVERHRLYGEQPGVERLDIIVFCRRERNPFTISENVHAIPTNSVSAILEWPDAVRIADKLFAGRRYDLIITQDPFMTGVAGAQVKRRHGGKLLVHFHGDFFDNPFWEKENLINRWMLKFARGVVKQADGIRAMSQGIADKLVAFGIPASQIRVISTPVDVAKFQAPNAGQQLFRHEHGISDRAKVVLHIGRNDPAKDYATLYRALGILCTKFNGAIHFLQLGAKLDGKIIQAEVGAPPSQLTVTALGILPHDQLVSAYHVADLLVSSSTHESFGKVLVEANAAGLPVVTTDTTGAKDIVQPGVNGYLVPVGDAAALAEKILHLLDNQDLARVMGERGQAVVAERFDGRKNTQDIVQFWRDLVGPAPVANDTAQ